MNMDPEYHWVVDENSGVNFHGPCWFAGRVAMICCVPSSCPTVILTNITPGLVYCLDPSFVVDSILNCILWIHAGCWQTSWGSLNPFW